MTFLRDWWHCMGHWRWLNLAPVVVALLLSFQYQAMPMDWIDQGSRRLGDLTVRVQTRGTLRAGQPVPVRLSLSAPANLQIGFDRRNLSDLARAAFDENHEVVTELALPDTLNDVAELIITHQQHDVRWQIGRLIL